MSTLMLEMQAQLTLLDQLKPSRIAVRRSQRLCDRFKLLIDGLALQPLVLDTLQIVQRTLTQAHGLFQYLNQTSAFDFYLRKAEITLEFNMLNDNLNVARNACGLRSEWNNRAKEDRIDQQQDEVQFRILLERVGGRKSNLTKELALVPTISEARSLLSAFNTLKERSRGGGFEAVFCRNAFSVLSDFCGAASSVAATSEPPLVPIPNIDSLASWPASRNSHLWSDPALRHTQDFFSPYRSGPSGIFQDTSFSEEPGSAPLPALFGPNTADSAADIAAILLREQAEKQKRRLSPLPLPQRKGSGTVCEIQYFDILTREARVWKPFSRWIWNEPPSLSRVETIDQAQVAPGAVLKVVALWKGTPSTLERATNMKRILPSTLTKLHPPIGSEVYCLAFFQIQAIVYVAATTTTSIDATGRTRNGLIPLQTLSASGSKPASLPPIVDAPLHESVLPFSARVRTATDSPSFACEGILNFLALEFWRLDVEGVSVHPLHCIMEARKMHEQVSVGDHTGKKLTVSFFVLSFRTKRMQGSEITQLLFQEEDRLDRLVAGCKRVCPTFSVIW